MDKWQEWKYKHDIYKLKDNKMDYKKYIPLVSLIGVVGIIISWGLYITFKVMMLDSAVVETQQLVGQIISFINEKR